ncbi:hypothetical protein, partial [Enterobacter hormaechei]|uniref:hypothetical protein n=1 Tax=Enterobacter hormaechei TaxID=158836 RepID=UPI00215B46D7
YSGCVFGVFSSCLSPLSRVWHRKRSQPRFCGAGKGCYVKSRGLPDTEKIMPAGLMPAAIRPILKLSFTKDVLRSRQLSVFRLPDVSHFFAF